MGRVAVLIDAENICVAHADAILDFARLQGDMTIVRLYGDFTRNGMGGWLGIARSNGFGTLLQLAANTGKNSTDIALVIDAMDLLFADAVEGFCLVSDDRDFVPLASRLRAGGKLVHIVCKTADARLKAVCSSVLPLGPQMPVAAEPPIVQAFRTVSGGQSKLNLAQLGTLLRKHAPGLVPTGKLRQTFRESGWFREEGTGNDLAVVLRKPAA